jgi:hypothetical protein
MRIILYATLMLLIPNTSYAADIAFQALSANVQNQFMSLTAEAKAGSGIISVSAP